MSEPEVQRATGEEIATGDLYDALQLRAAVFVVEQACAYLDPDGRDLESSTLHLWKRADDGRLVAYVRVLAEPDGTTRIGRVVTRPEHRGAGHAADLLAAALEGTTGDVVLSAQSHLTALYERLGFTRDGADFLDDGIPHTPMRRSAPA